MTFISPPPNYFPTSSTTDSPVASNLPNWTTEHYFVAACFFVFSQALIKLLFVNSGMGGTLWGKPLASAWFGQYTRMMPILIYSCFYGGGFLILFHKKQLSVFFKTIGKKYWPLLCLNLLMIMSSVLSYNPLLSFRRGIALLLTTLLGIYIGDRFDIKTQLRLFKVAFLIVVFLSLIFIFLTPWGINTGVTHHGTWRGVYQYKNDFGLVMALGLLSCICLGVNVRQNEPMLPVFFKRICLYAFLILIFFFILKSQAMTVVFSLPIAFIAFGLCGILKADYRLAASGFSFSLATIFVMILWLIDHFDKLLSLAGKDKTLSTRTYLWEACLSQAIKAPWFGYGISGFWSAPWIESVYLQAGFNPSYAHNGFLELFLSAGILGLLFFTIILYQYLRVAFQFLFKMNLSFGLRCWPLILIAWMTIANCVENLFPKENSLYWLIFISTYVAINNDCSKSKQNN